MIDVRSKEWNLWGDRNTIISRTKDSQTENAAYSILSKPRDSEKPATLLFTGKLEDAVKFANGLELQIRKLAVECEDLKENQKLNG